MRGFVFFASRGARDSCLVCVCASGGSGASSSSPSSCFFGNAQASSAEHSRRHHAAAAAAAGARAPEGAPASRRARTSVVFLAGGRGLSVRGGKRVVGRWASRLLVIVFYLKTSFVVYDIMKRFVLFICVCSFLLLKGRSQEGGAKNWKRHARRGKRDGRAPTTPIADADCRRRTIIIVPLCPPLGPRPQ